jgi:hypothetical protein
VGSLVHEALLAKLPPDEILNTGLIATMEEARGLEQIRVIIGERRLPSHFFGMATDLGNEEIRHYENRRKRWKPSHLI